MTKEQKILVLLILLVAGGGATLYMTTAQTKLKEISDSSVIDTSSSNVSSTSVTVGSLATATDSRSVIANNTNVVPSNISVPYTSEQTYDVPQNSRETIKVVLYVKNGIVEDVSFSFQPPSKRESAEYLSSFKKALATAHIKGKKVSDINLSRLGGASLTTAAFMKAVQDINAKTGA